MAELLIDPLTRITGNAALRVVTDEEGKVEVRLQAFGYRGLEQAAIGCHLDNLLPLVSRICGVDSLFHQVAAATAVEKAVGAQPPPEAIAVRNLALWARLFERHAVCLTVHSLPDLLFPSSDPGLRNLVSIYRVDEEVVRRLMALKALGTDVMREAGGAAVHPVNLRPGGVFRGLSSEARRGLLEKLDEAAPLLVETGKLIKLLLRRNEELVNGLLNTPAPSLALRGTGSVELTGDLLAVVGPEGGEAAVFECREVAGKVRESNSGHSHVRNAELEGVGPARVGPLARLNVNGGYGSPIADEELEEIRSQWGFPVQRGLVGHALRILEMMHAWQRMRELLQEEPQEDLGSGIEIAAGKAVGAVEAPEGTLIYELEIGDDGLLRRLGIVSPLQFNLSLLERSLSESAASLLGAPEGEGRAVDLLQMAVRAYAPCIPCGIH